MMKNLLIMVSLGAAMASSAAVAAQAPAESPPPLVAIQQPPPGMMQREQTRAQAQQRADKMFGMLDANKDGTVTKAEAEQALVRLQAERGDDGRGASRAQRMIDQAFGASQSITLAQFEAQMLARFDAMDLNHDGTVTAAERAQLRAQRPGQ